MLLSRSKSKAISLALMAISLASPVLAQTDVSPTTEYRDRIKVAQTIQPLGENPFGESMNLYKGGVSFRQVDVNYEGQGPAIVFSRSYDVGSMFDDLGFWELTADWKLNIPRMETIVGNAGWQVNSSTDRQARCTQFARISVYPATEVDNWWHGYQLITGDGNSQAVMKRAPENTTGPTAGGPYGIVTKSNWIISCIGTSPNEYFLAQAPDGTKYWFDHYVVGPDIETLRETLPVDGGRTKAPTVPPRGGCGNIQQHTVITLYRKKAYMYVSRIEDRFGNYITYNYDATDGSKLVSVTGSDGRVVNVNWRTDAKLVDNIVVQPGSAQARTWRYEYLNPTLATRTLSRVVLPDQSAWSFSMAGVAYATVGSLYSDIQQQCGLRSWDNSGPGGWNPVSITHPSGLVGTFAFGAVIFGRSGVPTTCMVHDLSDPNAQPYEDTPPLYGAYSLVSKTISGPGVSARQWTYRYSNAAGSTADECNAAPCATTAWVESTDPEGSTTRYTHNTQWGISEGSLVSVLQGISSPGQANPTGLRSVQNTYASPSAGPYPSVIGDPLDDRFGFSNNDPARKYYPQNGTTTVQDGVTFTHTVNSFDVYAAPLSVTDASTGNSGGNFSRTRATTYYHDTAKWVIGQTATVTDVSTGKVMSQTDYDSVTDLPWKTYAFGILKSTRTYNANGTLATLKDGRNNTITLSNWSRGIPGRIDYPIGGFESAVIDAQGWISSTTDQLGSVTTYSYDGAGRLSGIAYPSGDTVVWNPLSRGFTSIAVSEFGLDPGHWRQTVQTGNGKTTTYYDGLFQPVVVLTEDTANPGSKSYVVTRYDSSGRAIFSGYPVASLTSFTDSALKGTRTTYDLLGRPVQVSQDSEYASPLLTTTEYLTGLVTRVTNPRGYQSTTSYQVFDGPSADAPVRIVNGVGLPEQQVTTITRDVFGKPLTITRSAN